MVCCAIALAALLAAAPVDLLAQTVPPPGAVPGSQAVRALVCTTRAPGAPIRAARAECRPPSPWRDRGAIMRWR